ncbi:hypothetical protein F5887DRAFT_885173 [Amanita rubescens]|nr:hypothetical protein F5887DRAFT_885173 [Amanita rubescens]
MNNPHEAIRPDFNTDAHEQERLALLDKGLTPEQTIQTLDHLWTLHNDRDKEVWDRRLEETARAEAERAREAEEINVRRRREEEEEADTARREDKKKHKAKYAAIPDAMGDFIELFYFTNKGLAEAEKAELEDDSIVLVKEGESHSWVPSTSTRSGKQSVTKDEDLTWEEFLEAAPRMINFMKLSEWPEDHVDMFIQFWSNLQTHDWRFSSDVFSKRALLVYQGQQRKRWHLTISSGNGWSLAHINEVVLKRTKDALFDEARTAELAKLSKVSL